MFQPCDTEKLDLQNLDLILNHNKHLQMKWYSKAVMKVIDKQSNKKGLTIDKKTVTV